MNTRSWPSCCTSSGCGNADTSYHPIVGGGANGCVLHYRENNAMLRDGELLLVDAGCEYECYASDITRTWPVNGRFTPSSVRYTRWCWPQTSRPSRR